MNRQTKDFVIMNVAKNPWSNYWKRNQTIFHLLLQSKQVSHGLFVNQPLYLTDLIKHPLSTYRNRVLLGIKYLFKRRISTKLSCLTPMVYPKARRIPFVNWLNLNWHRHFLESCTDKEIILIINSIDALNKVQLTELAAKAKIVIFDWSDDFVEFYSDKDDQERIRSMVDAVIEKSDLLLCVNEGLCLRADSDKHKILLLKNGTNIFSIERKVCRHNSFLLGLNKPIIGYVGWIVGIRIDVALLEHALSENNGRNAFVFCGPLVDASEFQALEKRYSDLHVIPPVPYEEMANLIDLYSVCILPNQINDHTNGNNPIKIVDYLALGKPVVTTATAGVEDFQDVLMVAKNAEEFTDFLDIAISENDDVPAGKKRIAVAKQHTWEKKITSVVTSINETALLSRDIAI